MGNRLTLGDLVFALGDRQAQELTMPVRPIIDSRNAAPTQDGLLSVFFAFLGEHVDGHDYVDDAFSRGAAAAVVARDVASDTGRSVLDLRPGAARAGALATPLLIIVPDVLAALQQAARWWRRQVGTRVIGITGSVGKTTTKEIVAQVLAERHRVAWSQGSYNNEIGLPLTLLDLSSEDAYAVLELGMYVRGDIEFLASIAQPDVGVVTNVEAVHAERAGTIADIALAKRELVEALPSGPRGVAILNHDDERVRAMAGHTRARIFSYGLTPEADLWADEIEGLGLEGMGATLHAGAAVERVEVPLLGRHSVYTVLRGAAVGLVEGLEWDDIRRGLQAPVSRLRLVAVPGKWDSTILDDTYNASPPSALAALALLEDLDGRKIAVLGDMLELGPYEREGHLAVGCRAAEVASELVVVGERGNLLAEGAQQCGLTVEHIHSARDSAEAAALLPSLVQPGDVILVKGSRGVKMERIVSALRTEPATKSPLVDEGK
jgi:UDP-N-acetylmuramoyl-tripeptide--D-alanyl-D-alanine ligase